MTEIDKNMPDQDNESDNASELSQAKTEEPEFNRIRMFVVELLEVENKLVELKEDFPSDKKHELVSIIEKIDSLGNALQTSMTSRMSTKQFCRTTNPFVIKM